MSEYCNTHKLMCDVPGHCLDEGKGQCDPIDIDIPKLIEAAKAVVEKNQHCSQLVDSTRIDYLRNALNQGARSE